MSFTTTISSWFSSNIASFTACSMLSSYPYKIDSIIRCHLHSDFANVMCFLQKLYRKFLEITFVKNNNAFAARRGVSISPSRLKSSPRSRRISRYFSAITGTRSARFWLIGVDICHFRLGRLKRS